MFNRIREEICRILLPDDLLIVKAKDFEDFAKAAIKNATIAGFFRGLTRIADGKKEETTGEEPKIH